MPKLLRFPLSKGLEMEFSIDYEPGAMSESSVCVCVCVCVCVSSSPMCLRSRGWIGPNFSVRVRPETDRVVPESGPRPTAIQIFCPNPTRARRSQCLN